MHTPPRSLLPASLSRCLLGAVATAFASGVASAQWVDVDIIALTPIDVHCGDGVITDSNSQSPGPMSDFGSIQAALFTPHNAISRVEWYSYSGPSEMLVEIASQASVTPTQTAMAAAVDAFDVVLELSAPVPTLVDISFERLDFLSVGAAWPLLSIDFGNDGVLEWNNLPVQGWGLSQVLIGAQPVQVRISMSTAVSAAVTQEQSVLSRLELIVRPNNELQVVQTATGCVPGFSELSYGQVFHQRGLRLAALSPSLFVLGATAQPTLLTPQFVIPFVTTCLLMPSPDIVLWQPSGVLSLDLPAALRPSMFHVQAVSVTANGFATTDAYQIQAI